MGGFSTISHLKYKVVRRYNLHDLNWVYFYLNAGFGIIFGYYPSEHIYIQNIRPNQEWFRKMQHWVFWQESNLLPCDFGVCYIFSYVHNVRAVCKIENGLQLWILWILVFWWICGSPSNHSSIALHTGQCLLYFAPGQSTRLAILTSSLLKQFAFPLFN